MVHAFVLSGILNTRPLAPSIGPICLHLHRAGRSQFRSPGCKSICSRPSSHRPRFHVVASDGKERDESANQPVPAAALSSSSPSSSSSSPSSPEIVPIMNETTIVTETIPSSSSSSPSWVDGTIQLAVTAIVAIFSLQARHQLFASLIALTSTPTFFSVMYRLFNSRAKTKQLATTLSQVASDLQALSSRLESRDLLMEGSLSDINARLKHPLPPNLPPSTSSSSSSSTSELPFSQAAELRALRMRASRLETQNMELMSRLSDANIFKTETDHACRLAEAELQSSRSVERALRTKITSLELRVVRLRTLEDELQDERRQVDDLRVQVDTLTRNEEMLLMSLKDAKAQARRFENLLLALRSSSTRGRMSARNSDDSPWSGGSDDKENDEDNKENGRFWNRELQKKIQRLVPNSPVADELLQQERNKGIQQSNSSSSSGVTQWPISPLDQTTPAPSRIDGLPADGGFAGGQISADDTGSTPVTTPALSPSEGTSENDAEKEVGAFAFSRGEFNSMGGGTETGTASVSSEDPISEVNEESDNGSQQQHDITEVEQQQQDDASADSSIEGMNENEKEESNESVESISYLQRLEKQRTEKGESSSDATDKDVKNLDGSDSDRADDPKQVIDSPESETVPDTLTETTTEQIPAEKSLQDVLAAAKVAVKNGRQRGLSLVDADAYFASAVAHFEEALALTANNGDSDRDGDSDDEGSSSSSERSLVEGELGIALVAWAKLNIVAPDSHERLRRAVGLLTRRVDSSPRDTTALFNAGLCHSLLAATASEDGDENNLTDAVMLYEKACEMFERLLEVDPESRIACFNCALSYISLARLPVSEVADDGSEEREHKKKGWLEKALGLFKKALALKPGDAKATAYVDECRRQLANF